MTETVKTKVHATIAPIRTQLEQLLREAITDGRFMPGDHLSDRVIGEMFGVSRTVVREAVRQLEAEGLVTGIPHRGQFVTVLTADETQKIYDVRAVMEGLASRNAALHAQPADIQKFKDILRQLRKASKRPNAEELIALKKEYYDVLLAISDNEYVTRILEQLLNRNKMLRSTTMSRPDRLAETLKEMEAVIDAIERQDPDAAWTAGLAHVSNAGQAVVTLIRSKEAVDESDAAPLSTQKTALT